MASVRPYTPRATPCPCDLSEPTVMSGSCVPESYRSVVAAAGDQSTVGGQRHAPDCASVARKHSDLLRWLISGSDSLTPGRQMMLRADKVTFMSSEPVTATLLMREDPTHRAELPAIELRGADPANPQPPKKFTPAPIGEEIGTYRINFGVLPEGRYFAAIAIAVYR